MIRKWQGVTPIGNLLPIKLELDWMVLHKKIIGVYETGQSIPRIKRRMGRVKRKQSLLNSKEQLVAKVRLNHTLLLSWAILTKCDLWLTLLGSSIAAGLLAFVFFAAYRRLMRFTISPFLLS